MRLALVGMIAVSCATGKQISDDRQQYVRSAIENGEFKINVIRAYPLGGPSIQLSSSYSLRVSGDSLYSRLPYYGRAFSAPYGGGVGLNFDGKISDYRITPGRRDRTVVSFTTISPDEKLDYVIEILPDGSGTIGVQPQNRQSIQFDGRMEIE